MIISVDFFNLLAVKFIYSFHMPLLHNAPRDFSILHPFAYNQLCKFISTNWTEIKNYFYEQTMD